MAEDTAALPRRRWRSLAPPLIGATPLAVAVVGVVTQGGTQPVGALAQDPNNCEDRTIEWDFDSSWDSYPTARGWANQALGLLNQPLDYTGSPLMDVVRQTSGSAVGDIHVALQYEDAISYGSSECFAVPGFWINSRYISDATFVRRMTKHEMGHLLGAEHSGNKDSNNGDNPPIMGTCGSKNDFQSANVLTQDDYAYFTWLWSTPTFRQLTANYGFEQGTSFWGFYNIGGSSSLEWVDSGGATGPGYVRTKNVDGAIVYQTTTVATGDDDEEYRAVINYKAEDGGSSAQGVAVLLYRQEIEYLGANNGCLYADGLGNINQPSPNYLASWDGGSGWIFSGYAGRPTGANQTSWTWMGTSWINPPDADGYRFQVWAGAEHASPGWMDLDNVRVEGT